MAYNPYYSPLRYPGGKRKIAAYIGRLMEANGLCDGTLAEPYAGGASVALKLLFGWYSGWTYLNDADPAIYAFWHSVLYATEDFCRLIRDVPVTLPEWYRQRGVLLAADVSTLERGFAAFFLNRTNRAGIVLGGVMGGQNQLGRRRLDDRFHRLDLVRRVQKIARYRDRIRLSGLDAIEFLRQVSPKLGPHSLVYLDPPYFAKGQALYGRAYAPAAHASVAAAIAQLRSPWVLSYDDVPPIRALYRGYASLNFNLRYSAQERYCGHEVLFFSPGLRQLDVATTQAMLPRIASAPPVVPGQQLALSL